jgi:hypothetical protein
MRSGRENFARMQRSIIRTRDIMAAVNFNPAVASPHAKYDDGFLVPTLLGAQPLDAQQFSDDCSKLGTVVSEPISEI